MSKSFKVLGIYADGMVLQRNTVNCIFGEGLPGKYISLVFRDSVCFSAVDENGSWKIEFNPGEAGGPFDLNLYSVADVNVKNFDSVSDDDCVCFRDVFVGEVWVTSGQSNAQLQMERLKYSFPHDMKLPKNDNIRMITVPISFSYDGEKQSVEKPEWLCACPENIAKLSGTGYFFAKHLSKNLDVPIGIINASQGGSPVTSWVNEEVLRDLSKTEYLELLDKWRKPGAVEVTARLEAAAYEKWVKNLDDMDAGLKNHWENMDFSDAEDWEDCFIPNNFYDLKEGGICWFKKEIELSGSEIVRLNREEIYLWLGVIAEADKVWVNGTFCGETGYCYPPRRYKIPKGCLHAGKNTITVRVMKNSPVPIRFFEDKTYSIFTSNININLAGEWKKKVTSDVPTRPGNTFFEWQPTALFNSMLAPCFNYAVAGALWYQGESNSLKAWEYADLLEKMAGLWRKKFVYAPENMPFIVVQLPNWGDGYKDEEKNYPEDWAWLRNAQMKASDRIGNSGVVVMIDSGEWNDLHPEDKQTVGIRAANEALRLAYDGEINPAPRMVSYEIKEHKVLISFDNQMLENELGNNKVKGFYFVCHDEVDTEKSTPLNALEGSLYSKVDGKLLSTGVVEVEIPDQVINAKQPVKELRYLWTNSPEFVTLYSQDDLPVLPFRIIL